MDGPTCIFWAKLTPLSLKTTVEVEDAELRTDYIAVAGQRIDKRDFVAAQVRKTLSWPRSWADFSLMQLYSHRNAWAVNLHILASLTPFSLQGTKSKTNFVASIIFFAQTAALIGRSVNWFKFLDVSNSAAGADEVIARCLSPLSYSENAIVVQLGTPLLLCLGVLAVTPLWNLLRGALPKKLWKAIRAPPRISCSEHVPRSLLAVYLYSYAPITRRAIEVRPRARPLPVEV